MENGELLAGGEPQDISVSLILGIDLPQTGFEHPAPSSRSVAVDQFQDGDSIAMTAAHFEQKTTLGLLKGGQPLLDGYDTEGHRNPITWS